ncbi:MAG: hypothetical protein JO340_11510 [Acidobacteriaceae bacterium]|nr:hypothetical protein [Acidobacteriaceae bacterium]
MGSALETSDALVIPEATEQDLQGSIDHAAQFYLGISGDDFLRRWHAREFSEDDSQAQHVLHVINFFRSAKGEAQLR